MLKKILILFISFITVIVTFSQDAQFTKIETTSIKGNSYFPLFVGAKWTWTLEMFGNRNVFSWEITEVYEITDPKNNLQKVIGFKTICKEIESEWFFIEYDGYICFYEKMDNGYDIQKIIPVNPKIGDKWRENFRTNSISTMTDEFVKVDTETDDKKTIGYKIFRKDIGLFDLYEIEKKDNETIYTKWTLNEYKKYGDSKNEVVLKQDDSYKKIENKKRVDHIIENIDEYKDDYSRYLIKELNKSKSYIQIGSFALINNALKILKNSETYNYKTFIYLDKDNYYKVLIEIDKEEEKNIQFVRRNIEEKAFFKQRRK